TSAKVLGLLMVVGVGLSVAGPVDSPPVEDVGGGGFTLALIIVLYCYGGWAEMSYVAAEGRNPQQNIVRSLLLGTLHVVVIYMLVNLAFTHALGFQGVRASHAVAADVARLRLGETGAHSINLLICISALGAINGMIFTGARIYSAL